MPTPALELRVLQGVRQIELADRAPVAAKVYIVSFRTHNDDRPSKFIVLADNMKSAIEKAWGHGGADFQSCFDKATGQAELMKEGALRVL